MEMQQQYYSFRIIYVRDQMVQLVDDRFGDQGGSIMVFIALVIKESLFFDVSANGMHRRIILSFEARMILVHHVALSANKARD